ncbi:hypothetical protein STEG23_007261, partial [Scotinomys teguina]
MAVTAEESETGNFTLASATHRRGAQVIRTLQLTGLGRGLQPYRWREEPESVSLYDACLTVGAYMPQSMCEKKRRNIIFAASPSLLPVIGMLSVLTHPHKPGPPRLQRLGNQVEVLISAASFASLHCFEWLDFSRGTSVFLEELMGLSGSRDEEFGLSNQATAQGLQKALSDGFPPLISSVNTRS